MTVVVDLYIAQGGVKNMFKQSSLRAVVIVFFLMMMAGCFPSSSSPPSSSLSSTKSSIAEQLSLVAPEQSQVPEGWYTIPYWIENQHLAANHAYSITAEVYFQEQMVAVDGMSFYVEAGHTYNVSLFVLFDHDVSLSTTTTVTAIGYFVEVTIDNRWMTHGSVSTQSIEVGHSMSEPVPATIPDATFIGWYKNAELSQLWDFTSDTVQHPMTLYSRYEQTTLEFYDSSELYTATEHTLVGDKDDVTYFLRAAVATTMNFSSIASYLPLRHGLLVSQHESMEWNDAQTHRRVSTPTTFQSVNAQPLSATSVRLDFDTTYYYQFFAQYESRVYLSSVFMLKTPKFVPVGEIRGTSRYPSGGHYFANYSLMIRPYSGDTISIGGIMSNLEKRITRSGIYPIIVRDQQELYAHMIEISVLPKNPSFSDPSFQWTATSTPTFIPSMVLSSNDYTADLSYYPITAQGQLFAPHPFLEFGLHDVELRTNTAGPDSYATRKGYPQNPNGPRFFFRSFILVHGEYYYDPYVYVCENNCQNGTTPQRLATYTSYYQPDTTVYLGGSLHWVLSDSDGGADLIANWSLNTIYYYRPRPQLVQGITDGITYYTAVTPIINQYRTTVELIKNDGTPQPWASHLPIHEPGHYTIRVEWMSNYYEVSFTIEKPSDV